MYEDGWTSEGVCVQRVRVTQRGVPSPTRHWELRATRRSTLRHPGRHRVSPSMFRECSTPLPFPIPHAKCLTCCNVSCAYFIRHFLDQWQRTPTCILARMTPRGARLQRRMFGGTNYHRAENDPWRVVPPSTQTRKDAMTCDDMR